MPRLIKILLGALGFVGIGSVALIFYTGILTDQLIWGAAGWGMVVVLSVISITLVDIAERARQALEKSQRESGRFATDLLDINQKQADIIGALEQGFTLRRKN